MNRSMSHTPLQDAIRTQADTEVPPPTVDYRGATTAARNVIAGNASNGVYVSGSGANGDSLLASRTGGA